MGSRITRIKPQGKDMYLLGSGGTEERKRENDVAGLHGDVSERTRI